MGKTPRLLFVTAHLPVTLTDVTPHEAMLPSPVTDLRPGMDDPIRHYGAEGVRPNSTTRHSRRDPGFQDHHSAKTESQRRQSFASSRAQRQGPNESLSLPIISLTASETNLAATAKEAGVDASTLLAVGVQANQGNTSSMLENDMRLVRGNGIKFIPRSTGDHLFRALHAVVNEVGTRENDPMSTVWIGFPGKCNDEVDDTALYTRVYRARYQCEPVWMPSAVRDKYFKGFCKRELWSLLHYNLGTSSDFKDDEWRAYVRVNQLVADTIVLHYQPGDIVWINDYHLLLVPQMVRQRLRSARIGLFFHAQWPSSEVYRAFPKRRELLLGMLGADKLGFHTYDYLRHFTSSCERVLNASCNPSGITLDGRHLSVVVLPIGIDTEPFDRRLVAPVTEQTVARLRRTMFKNVKVIIGIDGMDETKGIPQKLMGMQTFFEAFPHMRGHVVLIQVAIPSRVTPSNVQRDRLGREINEHVGRINARYGGINYSPIHYINRSVSFDELVSLYRLADACLITSLRDGMNLVAQEFIACQRDKHGPLILSEFAGSARSLGGAVLVNPHNREEVAQAVHSALLMDDEERATRHAGLYRYVTRNTASAWGNAFLADVVAHSGVSMPPSISLSAIRSAYAAAKRRLFLLDYDGTLVPIQDRPEAAMPSRQLIQRLRSLTADPHNTVMVISGRRRDPLRTWLKDVPRLGLSTEHGNFVRLPHDAATATEQERWHTPLTDSEQAWKQAVMPVLEYYTERTPNTWIEQKEVNVTWHYRMADPEFGKWQAYELANHLSASTELAVEVLRGRSNVEVRPVGVNKGASALWIAQRCVKRVHAGQLFDFVLCIGDYQTDEDMFEVMQVNDIVGSVVDRLDAVWTCAVGAKYTHAKCYIKDQADVDELLAAFAEESAAAAPAPAK